MVYCTYGDVMLLIKTSKPTSDITSIIVQTDAEVDDWETSNSVTLSDANRKYVSERLAAVLIANSEPEAAGTGDYGNVTRRSQIDVWQKQIDGKLGRKEAIPATTYSEPIET